MRLGTRLLRKCQRCGGSWVWLHCRSRFDGDEVWCSDCGLLVNIGTAEFSQPPKHIGLLPRALWWLSGGPFRCSHDRHTQASLLDGLLPLCSGEVCAGQMGGPAVSKGSKQRPRQVGYDEFAARWDEVFGGAPNFELGERVDVMALPRETRVMILGFDPEDIEREETPGKSG